MFKSKKKYDFEVFESKKYSKVKGNLKLMSNQIHDIHEYSLSKFSKSNLKKIFLLFIFQNFITLKNFQLGYKN